MVSDWLDYWIGSIGSRMDRLAGLHWIHRIGLDWLDSGTLNSFLFEAHSGSPKHREIFCIDWIELGRLDRIDRIRLDWLDSRDLKGSLIGSAGLDWIDRIGLDWLDSGLLKQPQFRKPIPEARTEVLKGARTEVIKGVTPPLISNF